METLLLIFIFVITFFITLLFSFTVSIFYLFNSVPHIYFTVESSLAEWVTAFGTIAAIGSALLIALYGKWIIDKLFPPDLRLEKSKENLQGQQGQTRLLFKNHGRSSAEDVEVYIDKIKDNGKIRADFLPVPLPWTHSGYFTRNFHPNQYGYLDLCSVDDIFGNPDPKFTLTAGQGVPEYENIYSGKTEVKIVIFQKSGRVKSYNIILAWDTSQPIINVEKIRMA